MIYVSHTSNQSIVKFTDKETIPWHSGVLKGKQVICIYANYILMSCKLSNTLSASNTVWGNMFTFICVTHQRWKRMFLEYPSVHMLEKKSFKNICHLSGCERQKRVCRIRNGRFTKAVIRSCVKLCMANHMHKTCTSQTCTYIDKFYDLLKTFQHL